MKLLQGHAVRRRAWCGVITETYREGWCGVITETYREGVGWCDVITDI